jgi:DNA-binding CsgD family transcriptional regulator
VPTDLARVRGRALRVAEELVRALAASEAREQAALARVLGAALAREVGATVCLLIRCDLVHRDTVVQGPAVTAESCAVIRHHLRHHAHEDPLSLLLSQGRLEPRTARRELGLAWDHAPAHRFARDHFGVRELATLPLHGSARGYATYVLGRVGRDFDDDELALLTELRPLVAVLDGLGGAVDRTDEERALLTARELEVLRLLSRGHKAATIARVTALSPRTVHRHLSNIYAKLAVGDRLSAVNRARALGLLSELP